MDLTVNSRIIAAVQPLPVRLNPLLGTYELVFPVTGTVHAMYEGVVRWLNVLGGRVWMRTKDGRLLELGVAEPDEVAEIRQNQYGSRTDFALNIVLQPHQLELLNASRDGGDLDFELRLFLRGGSVESEQEWREQAQLTFRIPQSAWVDQLNSAKASNILLFEIQLPPMNSASIKYPAERHLRRARELFQHGNWRECVSECRQFAEELGGAKLAPALDRLAQDRRPMTKDERETILMAALQHYCHLAAHSESKFGELAYSRADAKLALSVAASIAAHYFTA